MWQGLITIALFAIVGYVLDKKYLKFKRVRAIRKARAEYRNLTVATYALLEDAYLRS